MSRWQTIEKYLQKGKAYRQFRTQIWMFVTQLRRMRSFHLLDQWQMRWLRLKCLIIQFAQRHIRLVKGLPHLPKTEQAQSHREIEGIWMQWMHNQSEIQGYGPRSFLAHLWTSSHQNLPSHWDQPTTQQASFLQSTRQENQISSWGRAWWRRAVTWRQTRQRSMA